MITTPTPRTDAATFKARRIFDEVSCVYSDFARQLETDLAQAHAEAARLREALEKWSGHFMWRQSPDDDGMHSIPTKIIQGCMNKTTAALSTTAGAEMLKECDDLKSAWKAIFGERRVNGMTYREAARQVIAERDAALARVKELEGELAGSRKAN